MHHGFTVAEKKINHLKFNNFKPFMSEVESKLVRIVKDSHPDGYIKKTKTNQIKEEE